MRYFDSREEPLGARSRHGLGRAAAGVPRDPHRRRALLGRRHLLEHADRGGARRQAAPRLADLRGQRLAADRPGTRVDLGGDGARRRTSSSRAAPTATSCGRSRSTACATSSASSPGSFRPSASKTKQVKELASWGCGTTMHVAHLLAPRLDERGPHQGHRFHARRHPRALAGRDRRHDAHDRARALGRPDRPDGGAGRARAFQANRREGRADRLKIGTVPIFLPECSAARAAGP